MLEAMDRWETEGGAPPRTDRPAPLPGDAAWALSATARGRRMVPRAPAPSLAPIGANHGRRSYPSAASEFDGVSRDRRDAF